MLRQRVITAVIMASLFLSAVAFLSQAWLALLFGVLVCLGGWEWSRLCGWQSNPSRALYVLVLAGVMGFLYHYCQLGGAPAREQVQPFLGLACLWWSLALLWVKGYPGSAVFWRTRAMRNMMGLLVLALAWMAEHGAPEHAARVRDFATFMSDLGVATNPRSAAAAEEGGEEEGKGEAGLGWAVAQPADAPRKPRRAL